ncbi:ornithine cyclodeaminase [Gemmobacter megaterium]|uniref:Ornithine cyclodeaminase n=1 Tax=Gemmobacter megaterium TaxID=1086013 RepID=A0A1N7PF85_9RHOB|nr:ornithine cyclodeaminase [Gemmobacter megaterium]GGE18631.1 ornithine cyclodeaminase [Gemmobacter megaterium]SIT09196.1 ornithine cyclodeaminase [Gemmobacter megaterium]
MTPTIVPREAEAHMDWIGLTEAFKAGHRLARAEIADLFLYRAKDTLLDRAAWIDGLGSAVKVATVTPGNPARGLPMVNGVVNLFDDVTGLLEALVDFHLVTKWKTAGDSLLAARLLARPDARNFLIVGAGTVGRSMIEAYSAAFPDARFTVWNRSAEGAGRMAAEVAGLAVAHDLEAAVGAADVIVTCTMSSQPLIKGDWLRPGQHLDLIGAYRPDMREVDDAAMARARVYVDSRATTVHHIGEIMAPLASGALTEDAIQGDYYDIAAGAWERRSEGDITICKNGGGAHLDLMTSRFALDRWRAAQG